MRCIKLERMNTQYTFLKAIQLLKIACFIFLMLPFNTTYSQVTYEVVKTKHSVDIDSLLLNPGTECLLSYEYKSVGNIEKVHYKYFKDSSFNLLVVYDNYNLLIHVKHNNSLAKRGKMRLKIRLHV
jgi:hypothetical protein